MEEPSPALGAPSSSSPGHLSGWCTRLKKARRVITPGKRAWRGASFSLLAGIILLGLVTSYFEFAAASPSPLSLLMIAGLFLLAASGSAVVGLLLVVAGQMPSLYRWVLVIVLVIGLYLTKDYTTAGKAAVLATTLVTLSLLGAGLGVLGRGGRQESSRLHRAIAAGGALVGSAGLVFGLWWLAYPGPDAPPITNAAALVDGPAALEISDPSQAGGYTVLRLTYGSGNSARRPEFAAQAALRTDPVDGREFIYGWNGGAGWARTRYWGFDQHALPINGTVWYP